MARSNHSLFDQSLDRSVFVTFFLGAVVPLMGFAFASERLIPLLAERDEQLALTALVIATGTLSLVSFLALRRIVSGTLARLSDQNERLEDLLHVASELADAPHAQSVAESAACWAQRLTGADASWMLACEDWDKPFVVLAHRGDDALAQFEEAGEIWQETARRDVEDGDVLRMDSALDVGSPTETLLLPLSTEGTPALYLAVSRKGAPLSPGKIDALRTLAAQTGIAFLSAERGESQQNFFSHMIELVVAALDTHIEYRAGHASRVAELANRVGRAMGLDDEALRDLHFGALFHDVGMLRIPPARQRDPRLFRSHPAVGARMLSRIRFWAGAAPIVGQHHERLDGAGYPDGLVGNDIVLGARILAVCDAWDAMRSRDVGRDAIPLDEALAELRAHTGTQFDPDVVACFEALTQTEGFTDAGTLSDDERARSLA